MSDTGGKFVGRGGDKLDAALSTFGLDVSGAICADFGCNIGGFTDCLLARGAARVYAVDTGYGALAWKLRKDQRVVVMERTNAMYCDAPEPVDLVAIDVAWTGQVKIVPAAMRWLTGEARRAGLSKVVSLLKPHYEQGRCHRPLSLAEVKAVCRRVSEHLISCGCVVQAAMPSVLKGKGGGTEFFLMLAPAARHK